MEVTTTKTPMVLHTTIMEKGIPDTLLPVVKPTRSRHGECYVGDLSIHGSQTLSPWEMSLLCWNDFVYRQPFNVVYSYSFA